ncbi:MAG: MarR family transcriptional regulator [Clostridia bacterium]|nr:MarR family transcriptional regulator [Clostridia bacterium]MBP3801738.1 MarR family transcriptional regulator [Clostridia bacterium]
MKEKILNLFFNEKLSQRDIAERLNVTKGYVSRIVTKDARYLEFKKKKLEESHKRHNKQIQEKVKETREKLKFEHKVDDLILKSIHNKAVQELSKRPHLSDEAFRKWNISAYNYNPTKKRFEFDKNLGRAADVPQYIKER